MFNTILFVIFILACLALAIVLSFLILKYIFKRVILIIRKYKNMDHDTREKSQMILLIFIFPFLLWLLDYFNLFSYFFPNYSNITREFDWLSFIGTYSATIVSSILLIFITEKDRNENTEILRESQRPYLDVCYLNCSSKFFAKVKDNDSIIVLSHGGSKDKEIPKKEYLTLCVKNNGQSVAIIDINKTLVRLYYKKQKKIFEEDVKLNTVVTRLSIKSGDELYIRFPKNDLYSNGLLCKDSKISYSCVFYRDLFNKEYIDECELKDYLITLRDNERL